MKFIASSTELLAHLQAISRVINNKNSLPILDNFLIHLEGSTLTMTASDIETTLITSMNVDVVEGNGKLAIESHRLLETLREFSDQPLTFTVDDKNLSVVITTPNGTYSFVGQNGDEYPRVPDLQSDVQKITIEAPLLNEGISKTLFCTADDELRPVMNGVYFDIAANQLTLVATDAHKLVRFITKPSTSTALEEENLSFILPKKPATLLKNLLPKETNEVEVLFDTKNARFKLENYTMICRQVEGRYPNYNGVIPQNNHYKITLDRQSFLNALKRVAVFANQASNLIRLAFTENQVHLSAQDIDFSISGEETITCQYNDDPINIGFKSLSLIEMLSNLSSQDVSFELSDPSRAGLIIPIEKEENEDVLMLLMPMLLND